MFRFLEEANRWNDLTVPMDCPFSLTTYHANQHLKITLKRHPEIAKNNPEKVECISDKSATVLKTFDRLYEANNKTPKKRKERLDFIGGSID